MAKSIILYSVLLGLVLGFYDYAGGGVVERELVNSGRGVDNMSRELDDELFSTTSLRPKRRSLYAITGSTPTYMRTDFSTPLRSNRNDDIGENRRELREIFRKEIGVRELTGKNDGKRIEAYLKVTGLGPGYAYCASFISFCFAEAGYPEPRTAWSPALFPKSRVIWERGKTLNPNTQNLTPAPADVFGLYFANLKRIAHVGFVDEWGDKWAVCVEGNTNAVGSNEGDGVYRKRRLVSSIYQVADWVSRQERDTK